MKLYVSSQTQKIHTTKTCSVTRRNITLNLDCGLTASELAARGYKGCKRCGAHDVIESARRTLAK